MKGAKDDGTQRHGPSGTAAASEDLAGFEVERVSGALPHDLAELIERSRREGFRFLERLDAEWWSGASRFDGPGEALFVVRVEGSLAGIGGIGRDPYAATPGIGRLRRLYVSPDHRRRGIARALVAESLALARRHYPVVRLRADDPGAARFYEALGFTRVAGEADATHVLETSGSPGGI